VTGDVWNAAATEERVAKRHSTKPTFVPLWAGRLGCAEWALGRGDARLWNNFTREACREPDVKPAAMAFITAMIPVKNELWML
jgi:hypothetical protein